MKQDRLAGIVAGNQPWSAPRPPAAKVIIFPRFSRQYVDTLVKLMLRVDAVRGESYLNRDLQVIEEDLVGAGADPAAVATALRSLETTVRVALWNKVFGNGS